MISSNESRAGAALCGLGFGCTLVVHSEDCPREDSGRKRGGRRGGQSFTECRRCEVGGKRETSVPERSSGSGSSGSGDRSGGAKVRRMMCVRREGIRKKKKKEIEIDGESDRETLATTTSAARFSRFLVPFSSATSLRTRSLLPGELTDTGSEDTEIERRYMKNQNNLKKEREKEVNNAPFKKKNAGKIHRRVRTGEERRGAGVETA